MKIQLLFLTLCLILISCFSTDNNDSDDEQDRDALLVDRANVHEEVISFFPENNSTNVSQNTEVRIQLSDSLARSGTVHVELFGVENSKTDCRIDWDGFKRGDLSGTDSYYEIYGTPSKPDDSGGVVGPADTTIYNAEIVFGSAVLQSDKSVRLTPQRSLKSGLTYIVHIYIDGIEDFKTWWVFKT